MRRILLSILVSMFLSVGPLVVGEARAQASDPSASELADGARRAEDAGHLDDAISGYSRAYQISGESDFLFSLAEVHRKAGHDGDALRTYQTYLRRDPQGTHRESAENQIKDLEEKAKHPGRAKAVVAVPVTPPPARTVAPSSSPPPSRPRSVVSPSSPPPPAAPVAPALVPVTPPAFAGGTSPGADLTQQARADGTGETPPLQRWVPWAAGVATVGLATAAIVSGLSASHHFDDLQNSCGQTAAGCDDAQVQDVRSRARRANILWALTGVAAVATGITVYVNTSAAGASGLWAF